jgi:hypothetical protein
MSEKYQPQLIVSEELSYKPGGPPVYKQAKWLRIQEARRQHT